MSVGLAQLDFHAAEVIIFIILKRNMHIYSRYILDLFAMPANMFCQRFSMQWILSVEVVEKVSQITQLYNKVN